MPETVAILGASDNPARYAHKAQVALGAHGHRTIPINPNHSSIDGSVCYPDLGSCSDELDTVTVYVKPGILVSLVDEIIAASPNRVILNPGTEDDTVEKRLKNAGIQVQLACTLVLLNNNQYDSSR